MVSYGEPRILFTRRWKLLMLRFRTEAKKQVNGFSNGKCWGYTAAQGGYHKALAVYQRETGTKARPGTDNTESDPAAKDSLFFVDTKGDAEAQRTITDPDHANTKNDAIVVYTSGRSVQSCQKPQAYKRSHDAHSLENVPLRKKRRSPTIVQEPEANDISSRVCYNHDTEETSNTSQNTQSQETSTTSLSSDDEGQMRKKPQNPASPPTDFIPLSTADSDEEFNHVSRDQTISQENVHISSTSGPKLCEEQETLVETILSGRNVFYTGSAGCGKSTVLRSFVRCLRQMGKRVYIVAPTGQAALNVHGITYWSYAGWGPSIMSRPMEEVLRACWKDRTSERLNETDVLVIDEISMMENFSFERLNRAMKEVRRSASDQPFGGVQLVVSGDFCQLPPIKPMEFCLECGEILQTIKMKVQKRCTKHGNYYLKDQWAFKSAAWRECDFVHINLTDIHRQKDVPFVKILEKLRLGNLLTSSEKDLLVNHGSETEGAVKLFAGKDNVRFTNEREFYKLKTLIFEYKSHDFLDLQPKHEELHGYLAKRDGNDGSLTALHGHQFEKSVKLRVGTAVILLVNLSSEDGLINGSQGTIIDFDTRPTVQQLTEVIGDHKRHRQRLLSKFVDSNSRNPWPVVRFLNGQVKTILPHARVSEHGGEPPWSLLSRTQIPLMAAWAMTIHKSQGMTLSPLVVDLDNTFASGMDYVALSRATSLDRLKVVDRPSFGTKRMDEEVKSFYREKFGIL